MSATLPRKAAPSGAGATERPQYAALARALNQQWRAARASFAALRRAWFRIIELDDPKSLSPDQARRLHALKDWQLRRLFAQKAELTAAQLQALDLAIEEFLADFAGPQRSFSRFTDPNGDPGQVQDSLFLAHQVGQGRAVELLGDDTPNPELTAGQRRRLLEQSFARLTDGSRLRFESRLHEIRNAMVEGFNRGDSPLQVARKLSQDLDGYEAGRLRTIVRTEMGIAAEGAARGMYAAAGVTHVEVIGDPNADALCTEHQGKTYAIGDLNQLPIYHPNCLCSVVPAERLSNQGDPDAEDDPPASVVWEKSADVEAAEAWAREQWPHIEFDFTGFDINALNPTLRAFTKLANEYPAVVAHLERVNTRGPFHPEEHASVDRAGRSLSFNPTYFGDAPAFRKRLEQLVQRKWFPKGCGKIEYVVAHEFGHLVEFWLHRAGAGKGILPVVERGGLGMVPQTLVAWQAHHADLGKRISNYGKKDPMEAWAEAFGVRAVVAREKWHPFAQLQDELLRAIGSPADWTSSPQIVDNLTGDERTAAEAALTALRERLGL